MSNHDDVAAAQEQLAAETETAAAVAETAAASEAAGAEEVQAAAKAEEAAQVAAAKPQPAAKPKPIPRALPRPVPAAPVAAAPIITPVVDPELAKAAEQFGRIDDEGRVYVKDGDQEREIVQFAGDQERTLDLYVNRYLDLLAEVGLQRTRIANDETNLKDLDDSIAKLKEKVAEPAAIGDLPALRNQVTELEALAKDHRTAVEARRKEAKAKALAERTVLVEEAESLIAGDFSRIQWRPVGQKFTDLLDAWKSAQRSGPRLDKSSEDALWKRFATARTTFDRERRRHFSELEQRNAAAKKVKEDIVARAEALSDSTDWGATSAAYRDLLDEWKAAGRTKPKVDEELWQKFRGAQDKFFAARNQKDQAQDAEQQENLKAKQALLEEAEALVPVKDVDGAKAKVRDIAERWEAIGHVPRNAMREIERRFGAVEQAIRDAEQSKWSALDPEKQARIDGATAQLRDGIEKLEAELAAAEKAKNTKKVKELTEALATRKAWLTQLEKSTD